ncbi:MAG: hypothetical protein ACTIBG_17860 [Brevibacterium aurantiacum]|uniref:hypothetical protein n=1 Tax=Brevibacterium aurantiacum TaxID=273384 RepID=UPI003F905191
MEILQAHPRLARWRTDDSEFAGIELDDCLGARTVGEQVMQSRAAREIDVIGLFVNESVGQ